MNKLIYQIVKEAVPILLLASIISSSGGAGLSFVEDKLFKYLPLLIIFPALNDLVGDFGTIISSKFTTILFLKGVDKKWWLSSDLRVLFKNVLLVALVSALILTLFSLILSLEFNPAAMLKILLIALSATLILTIVVFFISIIGGLYVYKRNHDPDNYLIPVTTAVADLTSMVIFTIMINLLF